MLMECEAILIFLYSWMHQRQMTGVNYFQDHSNTEIARKFRFSIINFDHVAVAK